MLGDPEEDFQGKTSLINPFISMTIYRVFQFSSNFLYMFYTECTLKLFLRVAFRYPRQQMVTEPLRALCMDRSCGGNELGTLRKHVRST